MWGALNHEVGTAVTGRALPPAGYALADAVLARRATTRVLLISGDSEDYVAGDGLEKGRSASLAKAMRSAQLQTAFEPMESVSPRSSGVLL